MKKITLLSILLISVIANAQTFAIYTEDPSIGAGVTNLRFSNGQGFALIESATAPYEGTKNYLFTYNGTNSYFHGILFPRNASNTSDTTIDLSAYSYYNLALKTSSPSPFYIRMRGNTVTSKVLIDPASNSYGFVNDNQWHFLSIPFSDFIPESGSFSLAAIAEVFVLRSNASGSIVGTENDFEVDNIYVSTNQVLNVEGNNKIAFNLYPNPANDILNINALERIESIKIYSLLGQKVIQKNPKDNNSGIDISFLRAGMYFVDVESQGKTATIRLIKE